MTVDTSEILCTVDVMALYTNIPHQDGIKKVTSFMQKKGATTAEINLCKEILGHILQKNYFEFNNRTNLHISGTAMGTRCAANYAIIFMTELEEEFLDTQNLKLRIWLRFINDIFIVLNNNEQTLDKFRNNLNEHHDTIKFTMEFSDYELPFLDTFIYKEENQLKTRLYHKPMDNKQYLLYTSCHPKQHKDAIPYGLLVRAKRICTKNEEFLIEARNIIRTLRPRKYPDETLSKTVLRILQTSREELLKPKEKQEDKRIRYDPSWLLV